MRSLNLIEAPLALVALKERLALLAPNRPAVRTRVIIWKLQSHPLKSNLYYLMKTK